ncbi:MAG TPA: MFS transporter [Pedococcus sp.]
MHVTRLPAGPTWLLYAAVWAFVGALSWTTGAVYLVREVGLTPLQLVLAGTALEVAYTVTEVPTGVLADLYSRRLSLVVSALVCGAGMAVVGLAGGAAAVLVGMAVWGVGWTFRSGAEDAWLADEVGPEGLGPAFQRGAQAERVGGLAGIAAAVGLAVVDLRLPLLVAAAVAVVLALALAVLMPERGFQRPGRGERAGEQAGERAGLRASAGEAWRTASEGRRLVVRHPVLLLALGVALASGAWSEGWDRLWEAHLLLDVGLPDFFGMSDVVWFGVLAAGTLLVSLAVAAPLVPRIERLEPHRLARLLALLHGALVVCALGFALAGGFAVAVAAYWATTVVRSLVSAPYRTWVNLSIGETRSRATVLSILGLADSAGEWSGGPALGWIGNRWGVSTALAVGAGLLTPVLVLLGRAGRRPQRDGRALTQGARPSAG